MLLHVAKGCCLTRAYDFGSEGHGMLFNKARGAASQGHAILLHKGNRCCFIRTKDAPSQGKVMPLHRN